MQFARSDIRASLLKKGFERRATKKNEDHEYYFLDAPGITRALFTKLSTGSSHKTYGSKLLGKMKHQLKLDSSAQLSDLIKCPMSASDYIDHLRRKGVIK